MEYQARLKLFTLIIMVILALAAVLNAEKLPLKIYGSADGMGSSDIFRIAHDSRGFLWFSTRNGLSRFDGRDFVNYRLENQTKTALFYSVLETSDGAFWISASDGLYRAEPDLSATVQPFQTSESISNFKILRAQKISDNAPNIIFEDSQNRIWGGSGGEPLLIGENGEIRPRKFDLGEVARAERGANVGTITEARDRSIWFGCDTGAMRLLPDGRRLHYRIERTSRYDETRGIVEDTAGRIWIGHSRGVFVFQPDSLDALVNAHDLDSFDLPVEEKITENSGVLPLPNEPRKMLRLKFASPDAGFAQTQRQSWNIERIYKSADGKIWIPANGSLFVFSGESYRRLRDTDGFPGAVTSIGEDARGDIWVATSGGAVKYERHGLTSYGLAEGLTDPRVHSIYETADGSLFVVHGDWRISRIIDDGDIESAQLDLPDENRFSWSSTVALLDRQKNWWALSTDNLYKFASGATVKDLSAEKPSAVFGPADGIKGNSLYRAFADSKGAIWFSTRSAPEQNGLSKFDARSGKFTALTEAEGFPNGKSAAAFAETGDGDLWVGFYGGGFGRIRDGRFTDFSNAGGEPPKGSILAACADGKNRLWFATTGDGLLMIENPADDELKIRRYTTGDGLSTNNIRSLTEDSAGNIYAGTIRGIDRLTPETGGIRHYSTADGLASDTVNVAFRDSRGRLWFGTPNGLSKLEPETKDVFVPNALRIFISNLQIAGVRYIVSEFGQTEIKGLNLGANDNNLLIDFTGVGNDLRYQYKLEDGSERDWSQATLERSVNFAGLAPGDYRFSVRAVDANNRASENPATVSFIINPPLWRRWEFIGGLILLAAFGVFALDRYRVKKTHQVESALKKSRAAETATRESETRFRTLAETASDAILTIDENSIIIYANEAVEKIFGFEPPEMIGEKLTMIMPEAMRPMHDAGFTRYLKSKEKRIDWTGVELPGWHKTGLDIPLEVSFGEFERDGKRFFTGIIRDVSERRRAEEALRRSREERLKELERVRTRIATDLHDDIGSSLTQIAVLSEVAKNQATTAKSEILMMPLDRIKSVSRELVEAMSDVVWAINPRKDTLSDLLQRMRRFASDVCTGRNIGFHLNAPPVETNVQFGANLRRETFAIFKESVNNAVKYAECRTVTADFRIESDWLVLEIADDGKGFDASEILSDDFAPDEGGNGLVNIRRRASELRGICEIESEIGEGTKITLKLPLHFDENSFEIPARLSGDAEGGDGVK